MEVSTLELPIHKHPLYPSTRFLHARCEGCRVRGHIYGGYRCNDSGCYNNANPGGWFHKECGESPSEINHPSHPEHPLTFNAKTGYKRCHLCGRLIRSGYCCTICHFATYSSNYMLPTWIPTKLLSVTPVKQCLAVSGTRHIESV